MDKRTFLRELRRELESLHFEERENAISYYEEYLHEAGPEREAETIQGFGSPRAVAAQIKADHAIQTPTKTPKSGLKTVWLVILAIFAAPIAMPLTIVFVAVIFAVFVTLASVVFAIGVTAIALVGSGLFAVVVAMPLLISDLPTFLFFLGSGAIAVGAGVLVGYATYFIAIKFAAASARLSARFFNKIKEKRVK